MKLNKIAETLNLTDLTPEIQTEKAAEINQGHASDLLSDVLAHAPSRSVLVTIQVHMNVLAVAVHAGLAGVIFASGRTPEDAVRKKAVEEKIPLYVSDESTFDLVGKLYGLGLRGRHA